MNTKRLLVQKRINRAAVPEPPVPAPAPAAAALDADAVKLILKRLDRLESDVSQLGQRVAVLESVAGEIRKAGRAAGTVATGVKRQVVLK